MPSGMKYLLGSQISKKKTDIQCSGIHQGSVTRTLVGGDFLLDDGAEQNEKFGIRYAFLYKIGDSSLTFNKLAWQLLQPVARIHRREQPPMMGAAG